MTIKRSQVWKKTEVLEGGNTPGYVSRTFHIVTDDVSGETTFEISTVETEIYPDYQSAVDAFESNK